MHVKPMIKYDGDGDAFVLDNTGTHKRQSVTTIVLTQDFTPDMVDAASDGSVRRVGPFEMRPGIAAGATEQLHSMLYTGCCAAGSA